MSAVNPFTPPLAEVSDVQPAATGYSQPKVWSARGRIGRLRYLAYLTVAALAMYAGLGLTMALAFAGAGVVAIVLMVLVYIPFIVLSVLLLIQRSHDMGWSGWTVLLAFIPFAALIWLFKAGTPGANRFGNPLPPNPTSVKILGLVGPVIGIIGVVAAVSLPAYQSYTKRAQAAQQQMQQPAAPAGQQQ